MTCTDNCCRCGALFEHDVPSFLIGTASEIMIRKHAVCERCQPIVDRERQEREDQEAMEAERIKRLEDTKRRLEDSGLLRYELGFDPDFPGANKALMAWMLLHCDHSVWIYGRTGLCKTRVIQEAARTAVTDRSVRYWPVYDLAARLTETSKRPEAQLFDLYDAELLILDDLGIANMTTAKLTALTAIVDRRYIGWDQVRRLQHADTATFNLYSMTRRRGLGGQIWITSQVPPAELVRDLATVNSNDAAALVRRLADMCIVHDAEEAR